MASRQRGKGRGPAAKASPPVLRRRPPALRSCWSPAVAQAVAEEVLQLRDRVDLADGGLDVVLDPPVADGVAVEQDVAGAPVAVARLADGADVAQRLAAVEAEGAV